MQSKLNSLFQRYAVRLGQARLRRYLLTKDERLLADMGFSRQLLEAGNKAWPWRENSEQRAIAELQAYSDAELDDIGLHRAGIKDAVRSGRPTDAGVKEKLAA